MDPIWILLIIVGAVALGFVVVGAEKELRVWLNRQAYRAYLAETEQGERR